MGLTRGYIRVLRPEVEIDLIDYYTDEVPET